MQIDQSKIPAPVSEAVETLEPGRARELALELGLNQEEYQTLLQVQGRVPSLTELYIYSLMWSEHCSYKHSKKQLRKFSCDAPWVLQGPGENAGVVDLGEGFAVAFKMESHNHPSAIEPYQGAATGVGGIIRDIFTMGARPIACLDSLRFGLLEGGPDAHTDARQRYLFDGAVAGIGAYGNCLGVPTVGGEVYFDAAYTGNCLINAMAVGLLETDDLTRAEASGPGNYVVLLGSSTGRDGIGGASVLASQEFDEAAENKRPAVQVGDPFEEKLLIEVCLELLKAGKFVALGDLGAAGLTSSASEMASRGGVGIEIDVEAVPQREPAMRPFEIMVSESQERMLAVVRPEDWPEVSAACAKWHVACSRIGHITDSGRFVVRQGQTVVADMPAALLAESAPEYDPESRPPQALPEPQLKHFSPDRDGFLALLSAPNICSRAWIFRQYDHQVQNNTVVGPGGDAAVLRIGDTGRGRVTDMGIALTTDCNGYYCHLDPYRGAQIALAEAMRNLACVGATPLAITDCLNFGNPEKPEVFWQFEQAVDGLNTACRHFGIPVVSGNVSFYNESFGQAIYPTPAIGMVGKLAQVERSCDIAFKAQDDLVILVGETADEQPGCLPALDLELEGRVQEVVRGLIEDGLLASAHDLSEGGLAVSLAESCIAGELGAVVEFPADLLYSESLSRILISCSQDQADQVLERLRESQVAFDIIGSVGGSKISVAGVFEVSLEDATAAYRGALPALMDVK
ncbi:MAG: phosphoribosylformylglycinamidine synthase subunit PurL [Coriobacteriales bacterium]|jgi:phosphoribosylformylglycinamidine synthase|nr:phosphoribosylformylglycinamidine synthase subunit PurL [Coriobacteriales bacterium]